MNKRKIIIIILVILLIAFIATGVILYISHAKENGMMGKEIFEETSTEGATLVPASSPDEVIQEIKDFYTDSKDTVVTFDKEEKECWYFSDSDGKKYYYCMAEPQVIEIEEKD